MGRNDADSRRMLRGSTSREHARAKTGESEEEPLALSVLVQGVVQVERLRHFVSKGWYK